MKQRVYVDTSVIGGCFDDEFVLDSKALFEKFMRGEMIAVVSGLTILELREGAPKEVQDLLAKIPEGFAEIVEESEEAADLARSYLAAGAVSSNFERDALHIALATIERVDVLVSWNFKHIVNLQRIRAYNSVNIRNGYQPLEIRSPKEVLDAEV